MTASSPSTGGTIVVGVDGSPSSERALRFAVDRARETGRVVHAVIAWDHPVSAGMLLGSVSQHLTAHAHCPVTVVRDTGGMRQG